MPEATDFLYPFIEGDETDAPTLMVDLARSAREKWTESTQLRARTLEASDPMIREVAGRMADRFLAGGRLFAFGNGGSATDADGVAQLYTQPPSKAFGPRTPATASGPRRPGLPLAARSLVEDHAVLTALSNDVGFDLVFSRQLIAHGHDNDIAMGFSTSGNSENLIMAFTEAKRRGMLTVGLSGYDGGRMAADPSVAYCLVARSQSVHRIQEAQAALTHALWAAVQQALVERSAAA